jgi:hypothetical protein
MSKGWCQMDLKGTGTDIIQSYALAAQELNLVLSGFSASCLTCLKDG